MSKTFNKETICCAEGFFEEVKAICTGNMHQIHTKTDKKTKKLRFMKFVCSFCVLFEKLGGLESQRRSSRKKNSLPERLF